MLSLILICTAVPIDGDTIACREGYRIRVSGIAAREKDGRCLPAHPCPEAPPEAATAAMRKLVRDPLECRPTGRSWDRIVASCTLPDGRDLACAMLATGTVAVWPRYMRGRVCGE